MVKVVIGYLLNYGYVFFILGVAAVLSRRMEMEQESCRKLIHIFMVFVWCILQKTLGGSIHMVVIPGTFVLLNLLSYLTVRYETSWKLPVFSAMERPAREETPGTVYYAAAIPLMGVLSLLYPGLTAACGIGLFCMAFGDGLAGIIGGRTRGFFAKQWVRGKSLGGSLACVAGCIVGSLFLSFLMGYHLPLASLLLIGICCAILELPGKGLDNLTVPFGSMLLAQLLLG